MDADGLQRYRGIVWDYKKKTCFRRGFFVIHPPRAFQNSMGGNPKIGGKNPKMDGENHGKPYDLMDDLGENPLFSETPI